MMNFMLMIMMMKKKKMMLFNLINNKLKIISNLKINKEE